jgi:hypothetical protein
MIYENNNNIQQGVDLCCVDADFLKRGPTAKFFTKTEALLKI